MSDNDTEGFEHHELGDIIKTNISGPPKYYRIIKITDTLFRVKKCHYYISDQRSDPETGNDMIKFWINKDDTGKHKPQNYFKGPNKKYIAKKTYPVYNGKSWWVNSNKQYF